MKLYKYLNTTLIILYGLGLMSCQHTVLKVDPGQSEQKLTDNLLHTLFINEQHYKNDTTQQTTTKSLDYDCNDCKSRFTTSAGLNRHTMYIHKKCILCKAYFKTTDQLQQHNKIHETCTIICNKKWQSISHLTIHMRTHTQEKPFSCQKYPKEFSKQSKLKQHERIHTGEKPALCQKCLKAFTQQSHLTIHMRIHTGEKPFSCIKCEKKFRQHSGLSQHSKQCNIECKTCGTKLCNHYPVIQKTPMISDNT